MRPKHFISLLLPLVIAGITYYLSHNSPTPPAPSPNQSNTTQSDRQLQSLAKPSKTTGCVASNGLPDPACTPGSLDPRVTQDNLKQTICSSGYTKTVRPPVSYTDKIKTEQMAAYGYSDSPTNYELDHLIPLELGGNPTDVANLWPEAANPTPGFHEKDQVENQLHSQVCSGTMQLQTAQVEIATNWMQLLSK